MKIFNVKGGLILVLNLLFLFSIHLVLLVSVSCADIFIVANKSVSEDTLSPDQVKKIFLGNLTKLDNEKISFVVRQPGDTQAEFLKTYIKKTAVQFRNYWRQAMFTGKGQIPRSFGNEKDLIQYVAENKGVLAYVSTPPHNSNVKVIRVE